MQNSAMFGSIDQRFCLMPLLAGLLLVGQLFVQDHFYGSHAEESVCIVCVSSDGSGAVESAIEVALSLRPEVREIAIYTPALAAALFPLYRVRAPPITN